MIGNQPHCLDIVQAEELKSLFMEYAWQYFNLNSVGAFAKSPDDLTLPIDRMIKYADVLLTLIRNHVSPFLLHRAKEARHVWKEAYSSAQTAQAESEDTCKFWTTAPGKLQAYVGVVYKRRLLLDSRVCCLSLGMFGGRLILFSDVLMQYSARGTVTLHDLAALWVEGAPDLGLVVTTPEDSLSISCAGAAEKATWLRTLQNAVRASIRNAKNAGSPPLSRYATYTFQKHATYKSATYCGQWLCGRMQGEGVLAWAEGKKYTGSFRGSQFQGYGKLEDPNGTVVLQEGFWVRGFLDGRGSLKYANGDFYTGWLKTGLPHGHGTLRKGTLASTAASLYTGEWANGLRSGYGVLDDIAQGRTHHGLWSRGQANGPGVVVRFTNNCGGNRNSKYICDTRPNIFNDMTYDNI